MDTFKEPFVFLVLDAESAFVGVVTYAAYKAGFLVENKAFLEALEEGEEGASAFAVFIAKRM